MGKKMDARQYIKIRGANENNLKNIDVDIPRNELVVLTGLSGSGKSSLAFDTIYAEGQRRYMESLSSYARQFLGQMEKPDVESIEGLSPAISIDQKSTNHNPRSTVGTVTEIYDYFRLLYARVGIPHCPKCGREIAKQSVDQMVDQIMALPERTKIQLLAPVVRGRKGTHAKLFERAKKSGYVRVRVDGNMYELSEEITFINSHNESKEAMLILAFVDGKYAGNCSFEGKFGSRRVKHRAGIGIALYQKYTGFGLGRLMLNCLLKEIETAGYEQAELTVVEGNDRAYRLYQSLGFNECGRIPHANKYDDGTYGGEILMVKNL